MNLARHVDDDPAAVAKCRAEVRAVRVEEGIGRYVVAIVRRTRQVSNITWGASPRASVALLLCSKALAALRGRDFVTPDDVKRIAIPALRHRVSLSPDAQLEGRKVDELLQGVLEATEAPRL
mgnify:CR=1 FL=1